MHIVLLLGGALLQNGELSQYVKNRCLLVNKVGKFDYVIISSRYSLNVPPKLDKKNYIIYENKKISEYLETLGVDRRKLILESASTDTIGSAIFSRIYLENILDNRFIDLQLSVITSSFHMPRARRIFEWAFKLEQSSKKLKLNFISSEDHDITDVRRQREKQSINRFEKEWGEVSKFQEAFCLLLERHDNYSIEQASKLNKTKRMNY